MHVQCIHVQCSFVHNVHLTCISSLISIYVINFQKQCVTCTCMCLYYTFRFALKTIGAVLEDWPSVKAVLTCDSSNSGGLDGKSSVGGAGEWPFTLSFLEQQRILESQQSTKHLDVLVYIMLAKTSHQVCS